MDVMHPLTMIKEFYIELRSVDSYHSNILFLAYLLGSKSVVRPCIESRG